jgi:hypothetical protein
MRDREFGMERLFNRASSLDSMSGPLAAWPMFGSPARREAMNQSSRDSVGTRRLNGQHEEEESSSTSVEKRMVNGHVVQVRKTCRNGKCETSVVEEDVKPQQQEKQVPVQISFD